MSLKLVRGTFWCLREYSGSLDVDGRLGGGIGRTDG